jgi:hypothetical protein
MQAKKIQDAQAEIENVVKNSGDQSGQAKEELKRQEARLMTRIDGLNSDLEKGKKQIAQLQALAE